MLTSWLSQGSAPQHTQSWARYGRQGEFAPLQRSRGRQATQERPQPLSASQKCPVVRRFSHIELCWALSTNSTTWSHPKIREAWPEGTDQAIAFPVYPGPHPNLLVYSGIEWGSEPRKWLDKCWSPAQIFRTSIFYGILKPTNSLLILPCFKHHFTSGCHLKAIEMNVGKEKSQQILSDHFRLLLVKNRTKLSWEMDVPYLGEFTAMAWSKCH